MTNRMHPQLKVSSTALSFICISNLLESGSEIEDDGFVGTTTSVSGPEVIVFSGNVGKLDKASMPISKSFMVSSHILSVTD